MVVLYVWSRCILIYRVPSTFNEKDSITYRLVTISAVLNYPVLSEKGNPVSLRRQSRVILILRCHPHAAFVEAVMD